jgi:hypothetical protein
MGRLANKNILAAESRGRPGGAIATDVLDRSTVKAKMR